MFEGDETVIDGLIELPILQRVVDVRIDGAAGTDRQQPHGSALVGRVEIGRRRCTKIRTQRTGDCQTSQFRLDRVHLLLSPLYLGFLGSPLRSARKSPIRCMQIDTVAGCPFPSRSARLGSSERVYPKRWQSPAHGAAKCVHDTLRLDEQTVADCFHKGPVMFRDLGFKNLHLMGEKTNSSPDMARQEMTRDGGVGDWCIPVPVAYLRSAP
jgi:hypothetical protein